MCLIHVNIIINTNSDKRWTMIVPWSNGKSITYSYKSIKDYPNVVHFMSFSVNFVWCLTFRFCKQLFESCEVLHLWTRQYIFCSDCVDLYTSVIYKTNHSPNGSLPKVSFADSLGFRVR